MAAHTEILAAALRLCAARGTWTFAPDEIVRALPHLNAGTVRTHITSRCCVNAPKNHPHKWDYFRRIARGTYEITKPYRTAPVPSHSVARELSVRYGEEPRPPRRTVHAVASHAEGGYTAACREFSVVAEGHTLDEIVANLKDALALHLDAEDIEAVNLALELPLSIVLDAAGELDVLAGQGKLRPGTGQIDDDFWALPAPRVPARALREAIERERDDRR